MFLICYSSTDITMKGRLSVTRLNSLLVGKPLKWGQSVHPSLHITCSALRFRGHIVMSWHVRHVCIIIHGHLLCARYLVDIRVSGWGVPDLVTLCVSQHPVFTNQVLALYSAYNTVIHTFRTYPEPPVTLLVHDTSYMKYMEDIMRPSIPAAWLSRLSLFFSRVICMYAVR